MTPNSYTVFRRAPGETSWGSGTTLPASATSYTDNNVTVGAPYEYQIVKSTSAYTGYGYVYAGINVPLTENRGKLLLVVDDTYAAQLTNELARLQQDIVGDGWTVTRIDVARNDSVVNVKNLIKAQYNADSANVKAVFLFGHVPVPYSGNIVPDGHAPDHQGAWPCDAYYGDMDGTWTDNSVNATGASEARIRNVPGDGKFDQTDIPSPLELMVGRVDLANMPGRLVWGGPATFPSELELLRNYLNKDHKFRHKLVNVPRRGIVGDYFGVRDGEAFAASGWRNLAPLLNPGNVTFLPNKGTWLPTLHTNAYLWAYGCGSGSYTSIGGIGNTGPYNDGVTTELVGSDIEAVFTLLFGSWLGDWDSEDNIQRAVLATSSYGLTCAWSGRPHWFLHHMALGEPIGFGARLTQNNNSGGLYRNQVNSCAGQIHIALMGDPTLRMHPVAAPTSVTATPNGNNVVLSWTAAAESVAGYHVYRATNPNGPFTRITSSLLTGTSYTDTSAVANSIYMVRAVKLESTPSGSYFNPSQGAFAASGSAVAGTDTTPPAVTITAPTANTTIPGSAVSVSANATDNVGVAGVQFKLDGANLGAEVTSAPYTLRWNASTASTGTHVLSAVGRDAAGNQATSTGVTVTVTGTSGSGSATNETVWIDDALPGGAAPGTDGGDSWNWTSSNPSPHSGGAAHQSSANAGLHQHFFYSATTTLSVSTGDVLFAYAYLDPANPPSEVMLQWTDGSWEHRAYWGANNISYGWDNTPARRYMGPLPAVGQWVRLEVPASQVGLEGSTLNGMAFTLYGGEATWDSAGRLSAGASSAAPVTVPGIALKMVGGNPTVTWPSAAGSVYRVAYKNNMSDPNWTILPTPITATGSTTSWTDTTPNKPGQRFYVIYRYVLSGKSDALDEWLARLC